MTKRLILMRHAKSSWATPGQDDHDRPLNKRGRKSAKALGKWFRDNGIAPEVILCSDAARTIETFENLKMDGQLILRPDLYLAEPDRILQVLQQAEGASAMIIGHNPGIGEFAQRLVTTPPPHARFADYPTGATLVVDVPLEDWKAGHFGTSRVVNFITPRELIGKDTDA
ncbi:SixA phosphatase family protein [Pseudooceanicola sp. MF1-13]|uniref:SixA phosphatase family protein n=1 Tax=Pseudooceanicola sp. MF1-13 TaxID=3379095 RepID=UPI003891BFDD